MNLNIQNISNDIRDIISKNANVIKKIGVFGSFARGDYNPNSDIDLLVEYNSPPVFTLEPYTDFCKLCNQIEERLINNYGRKVDIVHIENGSLKHLGDENIAQEVVWL
jgi:predicted nucleotidyltransferase